MNHLTDSVRLRSKAFFFTFGICWFLATGFLASGTLAEVTTLIDNGPSSNRVDMLFLGDGYTSADLASGIYDQHIAEMTDYVFGGFQEPFVRYQNFFNVHKADVESAESGADRPDDNVFRDTALDASYSYGGGVERLLYVSNSKANQARNNAVAGTGIDVDMQLVTVNESKYGGGGGAWAVYAGGNSASPEIALHELGHSFSDLADEYETGGPTHYTGPEPSEVNVTTDPTGAKWEHWIGYDQPGIGVIGAYEGAKYSETGLYRPSNSSKMRSLGRPFDAVSREKIVLDIYDQVDPLDSWFDNSSSVETSLLYVEAVDLNVIKIDWLIDEVLVAEDHGPEFNLNDFGIFSGVHTVTARAYDDTDWVRIDLEQLEQSVTWNVIASPELAGDVNRDGILSTGSGNPSSDDLAAFIAGWKTVLPTDDPLTAWLKGDLNSDGLSDLKDAFILHTAFQQLGMQVDLQGAITVPEPSVKILALLTVLIGLCVPRCGHSF